MTITNPTWAGPSLFVPITLDALLIGVPNQLKDWARVAMDYEQLAGGLNPAPSPFQLAPAPPGTGVHLHWTLPAAVRHGRQPAPDSPRIEFPNVPDRWLITRFYRANPGDVPQVAAWVLESDFLGPRTQDSRAYPAPDSPTDIQYLGRFFTIDQWNGEPAPVKPFLKAPGPGELSWAAVYDNVRNVFGFYDPMTGARNGNYSYAVIGWYANPADDPLYGDNGGFTTEEQWRALMTGMLWAVGSGDDMNIRIGEAVKDWQTWLAANPIQGGPPLTDAQKTYAGQTICQGLLFGINWNGPQVLYPIPPILLSGSFPQIAIGSTSAEALGAWMGKRLNDVDKTVNPDSVEDLLNAFSLNRIFDWVSNPTQFDVSEHDARFGSTGSGSVWTVIRPEDTTGEGSGGVQQIALTPAQTAKLTQLNATQLDIDNGTALLESLRWEIFSAGWKLDNLDPPHFGLRQQIIDYITALGAPGTGAIPQLVTRLAQLATSRDTQRQELTTLLGSGYVVKISDNPKFDQSADPVVLVAGAATDTKLDQPHYADDFLFTRFTGQTLGGLLVSFDGIAPPPPVTLTDSDLQTPVAFPAGTAIPKETMNTWIETLLLDLGNSRWLAKLAFAKAGVANPTSAQLDALTQRISMQQTLIWNQDASVPLNEQTIAEAAGLTALYPGEGVNVPSKISVSPWAPPWTPLYLDWEIEWHPTSSDPQRMLTDWQLAEFDFTWQGTSIPPLSQTFAVRTMLSSDFARGFGDQLADFLATTPKVQTLPQYQIDELKATAAALQTLDILTQSLTGLIQQMLMQQVAVTIPLTNDLAETESAGVLKWVPEPDAPGFFPIRSGHFQITKLQVVDAYGQILPGAPAGAIVLPIRSQSVRTPGGANFMAWVQLVPRVAQSMRLDFRLIDAIDDSIRSNSSDATSPICGWLLPNHLNNSLMVFDAAGKSLGELIEIERDVGTGVRWDAAPGSNVPLGSPPLIDNPHLLSLVSGLIERGRTGTRALDQLLGLIDVTMWSTDSSGSDVNGNLSVLVGRPIAVVRAAATLHLDGNPAYDQSWQNTGKNVTKGFPAVPLPLRFGDMALAANGLLGYYEVDDYRLCYAMYGHEAALGNVRRAVFGAGAEDVRSSIRRLMQPSFRVAQNDDSPYVVSNHLASLKPDSTTTLMITALVDPRGLMPAVTGVVPVQLLALPNGPVDAAVQSMAATFRMGPLLLDPANVRMPLPTDTGGPWSWIERSGVTFWSEQGPLQESQPEATLSAAVPTLREGWLKLSGAFGAGSTKDG
jgi:hypothetical protein